MSSVAELATFAQASSSPSNVIVTSSSSTSSTFGAISCPLNRTITAALSPMPASFNYLTASSVSTFQIASLEYLSLSPFPLNPNGSLDWNASLSNWITSNSNFSQWVFHIRPGLTWSNGNPVTSLDILAWASPAYALNPKYDFEGLRIEITSIRAINSDTIAFVLNVSDANFPNKVSSYYYAPAVSSSDARKGPADPLFGTAIADGPWYVSNYTAGSVTAVMLPNPYWPGPKPQACEIQVNFVQGYQQEIDTMIAAGRADLAGYLNYTDLPPLKGIPIARITTSNQNIRTDLIYNVTQYPYNMTAFRQALAYSINSSAVLQKAYEGYGVSSSSVAQGEVSPSSPFYYPNQQQYSYSTTKALELLHSIGFTGGGGPSAPLHYPNGTRVSLTIYTDDSNEQDPAVEQQVGISLTNLGINVANQTMSSENLRAEFTSNSMNVRNNLVVYSTEGVQYSSPWIDAQKECSFTLGCYGWTASHWLYPQNADEEYEGNLTSLNSTPSTNVARQAMYLDNIQALNAEYLPVIVLGYPYALFAYNTVRWTNSSYMINAFGMNEVMPGLNVMRSPIALASATTTTSAITITSPSSNTITTTAKQSANSSRSLVATTNTVTTAANTGTLELVAGVVLGVVAIGGVLSYLVRRKPQT